MGGTKDIMYSIDSVSDNMKNYGNYDDWSDDVSAHARLADDPSEGSVHMDDEERPHSMDVSRGSARVCLLAFKRFLRALYRALSSIVGLLVLLVIYSFIGAALFKALEGPNEQLHKSNITSKREDAVASLHGLSVNLSLGLMNQSQWDDSAFRILLEYEATVASALQNGVVGSTKKPKWNFWGAMFFCGTLYTTIGYGHIAPSTDWGRVMTMVYAAVGIPLALVCLADLGRHFTWMLKVLWAFCKRYSACCKKTKEGQRSYDVTHAEDDEASVSSGAKAGEKLYFGYKIDDQFKIPLYVAIGILVVYIFLGSIMYALWEEWRYLESFYFVFISISTIGLGDVLPAHPKFFLLSSVYVFIGLSLVSMCVNVAIEFFSKTIVKARVNIDRAKTKARLKAREAKEKIHEVSMSIDRVKDRAKERVSRRKSRKDSSEKNSPAIPRNKVSENDAKPEATTPRSSPESGTNQTDDVTVT